MVVCEAVAGEDGTWSPDGTLVFAPTPSGGLVRVPALGGTPTPVTAPAPGEFHRWPVFLADGRRFLYLATSGDGRSVIRLGSLDGGEDRDILESATRVQPSAGYLLFQRGGRLVAQPFDEESGTLSGTAVPITHGLGFSTGNSRAGFHASPSGVHVHRSPGPLARRLVWVDRTGREIEEVVIEALPISRFSIAPDGSEVVAEVNSVPDSNGAGSVISDLWSFDLRRPGVRTRLTSEPGDEYSPIWSLDSQTLFCGRSYGPSFPGPGVLMSKAKGRAETVQVGDSDAGTGFGSITPTVAPSSRRLWFPATRTSCRSTGRRDARCSTARPSRPSLASVRMGGGWPISLTRPACHTSTCSRGRRTDGSGV